MKRLLILIISLIFSGCETIEKVDKGICLKYVTFTQKKIECIGGRGVAPEICVVEHVPRLSCARWEWPEGRPEEES